MHAVVSGGFRVGRRGGQPSFLFSGRFGSQLVDVLRMRPTGVRSVEISGSRVFVRTAVRTWAWERGSAVFLFQPPITGAKAGAPASQSMLVASDGRSLVLDCSGFRPETFALLRRHLRQFVAIGDASHPGFPFSGPAGR